jgi:hypothetical protein
MLRPTARSNSQIRSPAAFAKSLDPASLSGARYSTTRFVCALSFITRRTDKKKNPLFRVEVLSGDAEEAVKVKSSTPARRACVAGRLEPAAFVFRGCFAGVWPSVQRHRELGRLGEVKRDHPPQSMDSLAQWCETAREPIL